MIVIAGKKDAVNVHIQQHIQIFLEIITNLELKLKKWAYSSSQLTIVTPSKWLNNIAKKSILENHNIYHIPYGLNLEIYQPLDSEKCKSICRDTTI